MMWVFRFIRYRLAFSLVLGMVLLLFGCSLIKAPYPIVTTFNGSPVYLDHKDFLETKAFQIFQTQYPDEIAKIRYLINLVRESNILFMRNEEIYSGADSARWLEYKLGKFREESASARNFIENVACYSRTTGKDYYLILPDHSLCPVRIVLNNELDQLETYLQKTAALP